MIARVAIDLALDRLFDYKVPEELERKLAVGQLLLVPFGHRAARGFVLEIVDGCVDPKRPYRLKPIAEIVDPIPFFSGNLLKLVKKIAAYTASPIESVLKAAVPAAVLKPGAKTRELVYVEPAFAATPVTVTARQQWLYSQVVRLGGGWLQQLCRELKTTPATLRELGAKGLVTVKLRQKRRDPLAGRRILPSKPLKLNEAQAAALEEIDSSPKPVLLHGVTGSGKTEVYLQAIAKVLAAGKGAIVLVPEIALTPQTVQRFVSRFGDRVAVLHSALSDGERYDEWHRIRKGEANVVIGPRSAVFAPVANLGLIVVDEEHETSYKQDETPRYQARDVAVLRASIEGARVVLGSATPSLESWLNAERGKYSCATLPSRAGAGTPPRALIVDMSGPEGAGRIYSRELLDAIKTRLDRAEQTILFLNRRGWARSVTCERCGHVIECPDCSVPYTYHKADSCCRCHICGGWIEVPEVCPNCKAHALAYKGVGTQRAEAALKACFKSARILRMDADSTSRKNSHDDILGAFRRHEADILLGTQMIAKGLDFPNVTLVGILNADSSLNMPDFRAGERTFQLLAQVSGRAGRAELPGDAVIQTFTPDSPIVRAAARGDYASFAKAELAERKAARFPPYCRLACVSFKGEDALAVAEWASMYAKSLARLKDVEVGGAVPAALEKAEGKYRWQIVMRSESAGSLVKAWRWISSVRPPPAGIAASFDMDAYSLM